MTRQTRLTEPAVVATAATLGLGALAGLAAYALLQPASAPGRAAAGLLGRPPEPPRPGDDAPGRTKGSTFGGFAVTGRSVTIGKPRQEVWAFLRDLSNLASFMEAVESVQAEGEGHRWRLKGGTEVTTRLVNEHEGEQVAWRSTEDSPVETEGKVMLHDAPAGRGTVVEAVLAWKPVAGAAGRLLGKLTQKDPLIQARRDLKRLKMLLEAGEIATNVNRREQRNEPAATHDLTPAEAT